MVRLSTKIEAIFLKGKKWIKNNQDFDNLHIILLIHVYVVD